MSLATDLVSKPPRERGATGGRYDFQTMWGLALLFQQHGTNDDYAIVFEFHDDIALLDSASNPTNVRFYQVNSKATNGGWTLTALLKREKLKTKGGTKEKPSFIDKMFDNVDKFPDAVLSADFVSNQLCGFNAGKTSFRLNECEPSHFKKIVASIQEAYPRATEAQVGLLGFQRTDLSLGDVVSHTKGKLQTFIAEQLGSVSRNSRDEPALALLICGDRAEQRGRGLIGAVRATKTLDGVVGAPSRFKQEVNPALLVPRAQVGMIGTPRAARIREDQDALGPFHEALGFGDIGAGATDWQAMDVGGGREVCRAPRQLRPSPSARPASAGSRIAGARPVLHCARAAAARLLRASRTALRLHARLSPGRCARTREARAERRSRRRCCSRRSSRRFPSPGRRSLRRTARKCRHG